MHAHLLLAAFTIEVLLNVVDFSKQDLDLNAGKWAKVNAFIDSLINIAQLRTIITHFDLLRHSGWLCQLQSLIRDLRAVISGFLNALTQFGAI